MKLDGGAKGHLPLSVQALDEAGWEEAKARHAAYAADMDRWIMNVKERSPGFLESYDRTSS